jgi:hypothetical protein
MSDSSANVQPNTDDTTTVGSSESVQHPARRWYHPRPQPRCATDVAGFNWTYRLFVAFVVVVIFIL